MTLFKPIEDDVAENTQIAAILGVDTSVVTEQREALKSFDNAEGQKIWPASLAFAKHLTDSATSSQVRDCDVIELGCGLGAVGIAAALAGAKSVVLTDFQPESLELARASAEANGVGDIVTTKLLDWKRMPESRVEDDGDEDDDYAFLKGPFDLVLGSDVLYSKELAVHLLDVVAALIAPPQGGPRDRSRPEPRCLFVDPPLRPCRSLLPELCSARSLYWGGEAVLAEAEEKDTVRIDILRG